MREPVVSYKVAKLAKEKGFDEKCINWFDNNGNNQNLYAWTWNTNNGNRSDFACVRPTQSLLQKWIRERYSIHIEIKPIPLGENGFKWIYELGLMEISSLDNVSRRNTYSILTGKEGVYFDDYEEALDDGLFEALKLIKLWQIQ